MLLYIIRHGDPDYSTDSLTERGVLQAEAVGRRMQDAGINKIFSSPMGRAKQTAQPACRMLGLDYEIEDWAHEIEDERLTSFGGERKSITFVPTYQFRTNGGLDLGYDKAYENQVLVSTEMKKAVKYIEENGKKFLQKLGYKEENGIYRITKPNDDKVALFCHAAFSKAWLSVLLHIPLHMMWSCFDYTHTGVTVLEFVNYEDGFTSPRCLCFSDISHLYASGLDTLHCNRIKI